MPVTNNIRKFRLEKHINQKELALAAGTCIQTISRLERGERNPSLELALRIAQCLGYPVEEVFSLDPVAF